MFYESAAEGSGGELRSVVRPDRQPIPGHGPSDHRRVDTSQRLDGSAPHVETPCDEFSGAAIHDGVEVDPAVLGCPDFGHVHMPQLVRPSHPEVSGSATSSQTTRRLQKPMGAHDPLCPLPVNRLTQLARGDGCDHPSSIGRMRFGDLHNRRIIRTGPARTRRRRPTLRRLVDRLATDLSYACRSCRLVAFGDQLTGPGDTHTHSQSRNNFPATSKS